MDNNITQYDEFAERHNAAYAAYRAMYEQKTPPPQYPKIDRSDWYISAAVGILVLASVIVSGSRTIPEFGGGVVGVAAFIMLELAIVAYAFIRTKNHANADTLRSVRRWTGWGLALAFVVAVGANVHATLVAHNILTSPLVNTIITLFLGISAPTLALISGDILAVQYLKARSTQSHADEQYAIALSDWQDGLNRSWASQQKRWGVHVDVQPLSQSVPAGHFRDTSGVPELSQGDTSGTASGTPRDRQQIVRDILDSDPQAIDLSVRELASRAGVSKSVAGRVLQEYRGS